ncbi:hypothetical protein AKJ58_00645 [candidate division MSBL1 archaeon SCGC-AAA385D11]|uniref:Uncharacterized protein n=1 Tax=candidate division MSBL1 archaeon SCGC-AAA385D11 TaxID=1698286 RepID=A0A133VP27_9EURY|nr:hypothetical protein AKJ58_00645 [candidate division MSBL1 archaeon SCGC-AAA385D11]
MIEIHERIKEKLNEEGIDRTIKEFLRKILAEELRHFEEKRWRYGKKYDQYIKKYASVKE